MPLTPEQQQELSELRRLEELEKKFSQKQPESHPYQAALEGFGQTATWGHLPQFQAGVGKVLGLGDYTQLRDENIARQEQQGETNPVASLVGKIAGVGAGMLLPMGAIAGTGSRAAQGLRTGAAMGAAYNPGDTKGEIHPFQPQQRLGNAAIGGVTGGLIGGIGDKISTAARRSRTIGDLKNSADLSPKIKSEVDAALQSLNEKKIAPAASKLEELLKGKSVEVDPTDFKGINPRFDKYSDLLAERAGNSGEDLASIEANKANVIKRNLDRQARYAQSTPFEPGSAAREKSAKSVADLLRNKIANVDPGVAPLNEEMGQAIRIRNTISRQAKNRPLRAINGKPGTDQGSMIDFIDKYGGSKLEQRAQDIDISKSRLFPHGVVEELVRPLEAPKALYKLGVRGAGAASNFVEPASNAATDPQSVNALSKILMEWKR